jgi:Flp pilus assembly protein CpaB
MNLKRSNRLVLLVGVFLAIVAFVGILLLLQQPAPQAATTAPPTQATVVIATADIPLSSRIRPDQVGTKVVDLAGASVGYFTDVSQVIGQTARQPVTAGAQITATTLSGTSTTTAIDVQTPEGLRAISVRVDQISGVGTVIKAGDWVDGLMSLTEEQFASVTANPENPDEVLITNPGPKGATVKLMLQGMQVLATLRPPQPAPVTNADGTVTQPAAPGTVLNDSQELVILAVTAQQAELIRYGQLMANPLATLSLVLRSTDDFVDPATGEPIPPVITETSGVVLQNLIDTYGVLPPTIVTPILPSPTP